MNAPFGGTVGPHEGASREALARPLADALVAAQRQPWALPEGDTGPDVARVVPFTVGVEGVTYGADLARCTPWPALVAASRSEALAALAAVGRALSILHARGVVHGDVRPEVVWRGPDARAMLLTPSHGSPAGATLRARLHPGAAPPSTVGYAAPEVTTGVEATAASDAYGLAAITYAALTSYAPLGQLVASNGQGELADLSRCVAAALGAAPATRPSVDVIAQHIDRAARADATQDALRGDPYRNAPGPFPQHAPSGAERSPVLMVTLLLGGLFTFLGAVMLVTIGWSVVGAAGRVALLSTMAAASWALGALAARYKVESGALVARGVAALFATVALAYAFSQASEAGRLLMLVGLSAGSLVGGSLAERRGAPLGGAVLLGLGSQLVWAVGAQVIAMSHGLDGAGPIAALAAVVTTVTFALAWLRRAGSFGALAAADFAAFAFALGAWLSHGSPLGPSMYALAVAAGYALLAWVLARREALSAAQIFSGGAMVSAIGSVCASFVVLADHDGATGVTAAAWPYAVALVAAPLTGVRAPLRSVAVLVSGAVVAFAPTAEALARGSLGYTAFAALVGVASVGAALRWERLRAASDARGEFLIVSLFSALAAPGLRLFMAALSGDAGAVAPAAAWGLAAAIGAALLALSYASTAHVGRSNRRLVEAAALVPPLVALTVQSLRTQAEPLPVAALFGAALGLLALGLATRRACVLTCAAVALFVNGCVQYFVRLEGVFPVSVRMVGFGVSLLLLGVLYEQQVRPRVASMRDWN